MLLLGALAEPTVAEETVRRTVDDVLSQPEYGDMEPSLVEQAITWIGEQIGRLIELIAGGGAGGIVAAVVLVVVVAALTIAGVRFLRRLRPDPEAAAATPGQVGRTAADWLAEAAEHEAAGRHRAALRCHYRALIADLARAGLVDEVPGRTTGEYLEEARTALPGSQEALVAATLAFERAWYGDAPVAAGDVGAFTARADAVHRALQSRRRGQPVGAA